jgi:CDI immunity protein
MSFSTYSGFRMSAYDPSGSTSFIPESSQDETLGAALIQSLGKSRVLKGQQALDFFALEERERAYEQWVHSFLAAHGNSCSRTALFKGMKLCGAFVLDSELHLKPKRKERGEAWSGKGITEEDIVVIPFHSGAEEVGAAIRKALAKCL